tara:strand:- start:1594 stop:2526 length:933 start_codon:yes stop_codon:yes gene_type:complete
MKQIIKNILKNFGINRDSFIYKILKLLNPFIYLQLLKFILDNYKTFKDKLELLLNYINHKKVKPKHLFYGQLTSKRSVDMLNEIDKQILAYKKTNKNKFIFIEIGNYLGESLDLFGERIHYLLKDNYLIISIDPYSHHLSDEEKSLSKNSTNSLINKNITKIYNYFMNNISNSNYKHNHFHLRMKSDKAFELLKSFNIKIDFCYIDGNHYYENFKSDFLNYNSILKNTDSYKGKISGDDYELTFDEVKEIYDISETEAFSILKNNKKIDYLNMLNKNNINQGFHPGITLLFKEIDENIKKFESGFWIKNS